MNTGALFPYHVIMPESVWQEKQAEIGHWQRAHEQLQVRIAVLTKALKDAGVPVPKS